MNRSTFIQFAIVLLIIALNGKTFGSLLKQGIAVKGKLFCGSLLPTTNLTKVSIVDIDYGIDPDDTLDEKFLTKKEFSLKGFTHELTPIDPALYIWTKCNSAQPCHRKIRFDIPKDFIIKDESNNTFFDFESVNLQSVFELETTECL